MKHLAFLVPLLAVTVALPPAARSQRYSPLTYVLEIGGERVVLAEFQSIDSTATLVTYAAELSVASVTPILSEFFSSESPLPRSGRVYAVNDDGTVQGVRSLANVSFTEVHLPVLDASSKSTAFVTVRFEAESVKSAEKLPRIEIRAPEDWLSSNFRVQIGQLPLEHVMRIDALTVRRTPTRTGGTGGTRTQQASSQLEVLNLRLTISFVGYSAWKDWHDSYITQGAPELAGTIELLSTDMLTTLFRYDVQNVELVSVQMAAMEANKEEIPMFTVELHVGSVRLR